LFFIIYQMMKKTKKILCNSYIYHVLFFFLRTLVPIKHILIYHIHSYDMKKILTILFYFSLKIIWAKLNPYNTATPTPIFPSLFLSIQQLHNVQFVDHVNEVTTVWPREKLPNSIFVIDHGNEAHALFFM